jgi:uncharacterized protein
MNRRSFFHGGLMGSLAAGAALNAAPADPKKILNYQSGMRYRQLANTDLQISVVSLGGLVSVEAVIEYGIERGVNLVHVASNYLGGQSIKTLGNVMKTKRDKVYIALKDTFRNIDDDLKALNTDYIDFIMFNRHTAESAADPKILETFEKWKQQGKVRYAGLTSHSDVKASTAAGIKSGMYSIVMPALNQPNLESMDEELRLATEKKVGVMVMKSMRGIKGEELETAFLKKLLSNPAITTVTKGIGSYQMFDAYQKAASEALTAHEDRALYRYAQANRSSNCMACDECKRVCPAGVDVSTILRCKDYYNDQLGDVLTAASTWREIPRHQLGGAQCEDCGKCEIACPNGIRVVERIAAAREHFSALA